MANIVKYNSVSIQEIMSRVEQYKHNPSAIQRNIYDLLTEITNGDVDIVDPTNPFVFLLEASSINTALAINENVINLRKQYPSLSQTEDDLYHHMSDVDFINRFSSPATGDFVFTLQLNELKNKLVYDSTIDGGRGTIARDTSVLVDDYGFSLQYPIEILLYNTGILRIQYNTDISSPLDTLSTNIIDYKVKKDANGIEWVYFTVPMQQFVSTSSFYPIQLSTPFNQTIDFVDKYYYARVWSKSSTNTWVEMKTTHTEQVYDPFIPTAVLKVTDNKLNVSIPSVYTDNGLVSSNVRVDVYVTKGNITLNLSNYNLDAFTTKFLALDEQRDLDQYTAVVDLLTIFAFSASNIDGGTNGLTFNELRDRVISNSLGGNNLPITNSQLSASIEDKGFSLVKDIDVITNRVFLAIRALPKPLNNKLVTSSNMAMMSLLTDQGVLSNSSTVVTNTTSQTILSNNLFELTNGKLKLLDDTARASIDSLNKSDLALIANSRTFLFNPFYYVMDYVGNEFKVRVYDLDSPSVSNISFISQNQTLQLIVNTGTYTVNKTPTGFTIVVITKSDSYYKQLNDAEVSSQISFTGNGNATTFINGALLGRDGNNERIFEYQIDTNYYLDANDQLTVTNSHAFDTNQIDVTIPLSLEVNISHNTTSITNVFVSSAEDLLIGGFLLPTGSKNITYEGIQLHLGDALNNLWKRNRTVVSGLTYSKYAADVPMFYDRDVYDVDPITNSIFTVDVTGTLVYNVLHKLGDPVLDATGNPVYSHRAGDTILDVNGDPVIDTQLSSSKELDLLLVDGKYLLADESNYIDYKLEVAKTITGWNVNELSSIQSRLLEQTKIFFYPKSKIGDIDVYPDNLGITRMLSEQSFNIDIYVTSNVFSDVAIRTLLTDNSITLINDYISTNSIIVMNDLSDLLRLMYGNSIVSFTISGLGGSNNYSLVRVSSGKDSISLKKRLVLQQDNSLIVEEDVSVVFHEIIS